MVFAWLDALKSRLENERMARIVADDPAMTAELLLLFRVILADGAVEQSELDTFKRICRDGFGLDPDAMEGVYRYLQDFAYETSAEQAAAVFKNFPQERRQALLDHMIAIVQADKEIDIREERFLTRVADMLGFDIKQVSKSG
ncbi:TerB family tellurite resistance protein [Oricola thermophila]|uniref:TerB family tellurite resistance protein n=1 Tax=Oricola thermophila TaxID=2742145 RepID=A0A6N1VE08_9HYPH|nr:TerB family tellurite resistance protein [Oricola thermophila]QKV17399.1 TerB family tellurite resistance protein [Oricola thermophila]